MHKVFKFIKDHVIEILVAIAAVVGGFLIFRSKDDEIDNLKDAIVVAKHEKKVAKLEQQAKELTKDELVAAEEDFRLQKKIIESKRKVVEKRDKIKTLSDAEVVSRYNQLYAK